MALGWRRGNSLATDVPGRTEYEPLAGTEFQATGSLRSERTLDPTKAVEPVMCLTCS